jgi:hypothetical protein
MYKALGSFPNKTHIHTTGRKEGMEGGKEEIDMI